MQPQRFTATVEPAARWRAFVPVPFDPDEVWRVKPQHHIAGTINGYGMRTVIETHGGAV